MKTAPLIPLLLVLATAASAAPQPAPPLKPPSPPPPPPQVTAAPPTAPGEVFVYDQKPLPGQPVLIAPQQAQAIIEQFKAAYPKLGSPRLLIYVNRDLVDETTGLKLTEETRKTESSRSKVDSKFDTDPAAKPAGTPGSVTVNAGGNVTVRAGETLPGKGTISGRSDRVTKESRYRLHEKTNLLADRQTVRDVERLFGRPLRAGGATLADQRVATQLIAGQSLKTFKSGADTDAARKDREALSKVADVVLEVLVSSRQIVVQDVSGEKAYTVPDIQATAIRLKDSQILGQASASDVLGKDRYAGRIARSFDVREIAEATALALMEDLSGTVK